jgi:uncharacterized protein GlcG (DUF336 family)
MPNGMTLGHDGCLVVCEQGTRSERARISRVDPRTGRVETLVDGWGGLRLNSPNDVVVRRDGTIWFTDPSYGYRQGFRPEPRAGDYVYRFDPGSGRLSVVADSFDKPNGLAFSPDERTLYVTDSGANQEPGSYHVGRPHHVVAFDVLDGRHLGPGRLFAVTTPGFPDGGGELMCLWRPDRAQVASVGVATDKARTAALYRRPSKDFEDQAAHGRPSALQRHCLGQVQGGVPVVHRGYVIAAVGVSGASSADEDNELARLAADAAAAAQDGERDDGPGMPPGPARR